ncbi:MAG: NTP transferase domain-containing protein [Promethearchaeia archaeon]
MRIESVILAAGYSSRFNFEDNSFKKYMLPFERSNILNYVILAMVNSGIERINIIVDKNADQNFISSSCFNFFEKLSLNCSNFNLNFIINNQIDRENGYSLYLGVNEVKSDFFILSMADHIFSDNVYSILIDNYNDEDVVLATDPMKIEGIYNLDDCTKVLGENRRILEIGKKIENYNRLDMGAFIMKTRTVRQLAEQVENKQFKFGVSDVLINGIKNNFKICYLDFDNTLWLDVDDHVEYNKLKNIVKIKPDFKPFNLDLKSS